MNSAGTRASVYALALYLSCTSGLWAQPEFENLDFEDANVSDLPENQGEEVSVTDGLPGWSAYIGTNQLTQVGHNWITLDAPNVAVWGPEYSFGIQPLEGTYTAILQAGDWGNPVLLPASIAQTGLIPAWARSLQFKASISTNDLSVTVGGLSLPFVPLGSLTFGCDISAFAGSVEEIRFAASNNHQSDLILLDAITFSAQPIPVPSKPIAAFSATPINGVAPLAVTFTDTSIGTITNRFWSFGDGSTTNTTLSSLVHVYSAAGNNVNTVSLTVSGPGGSGTMNRTNYIVVTSTNVPPGRTAVFAWGCSDQSSVPNGLTNVVAVAAGEYYSLALKANGTVIAWGDNNWGKTSVPTDLTNAVAIAAGYNHSLALKADGTVVAWGDNTFGQCTVPANLTNAVAIASGEEHSLALKSDGIVVAWGWNGWGQCSLTNGLTNAVAIDASYEYSLALKADGTVVASGYSLYDQCNVPADLTNVVTIAAGGYQGLALKADGTVVAWGENPYGDQGSVPADITNAVAIAGGSLHSLVLKADGTVVAWGDNAYGQINVPPSLKNVTAISAGYCHNLALVGGASAPSRLTATAVSSTQINLSWTDNSSNEDRFGIERAASFAGPWSQIGTVDSNVTMYSDMGVSCGQTYYYRVRSYNAVASSLYSDVASANTSPDDTDCDGLPNSWTQQYFGHPTGQASDKSRAQDDPDGDGFTNLQEFQAGTDPTNSASAFRIISVAQEGDDIRVTWATAGGRTNLVQATSDLEGGYSNISPNILITGSGDTTTNFVDAGGAANAPSRYYRIRLVP